MLRAFSKCLLNIDSLGASTTFLGSFFQCLTTILVKEGFLMYNINLPWCSFKLFQCILSLDPRRRAQHFPLHLPPPQEAVESIKIVLINNRKLKQKAAAETFVRTIQQNKFPLIVGQHCFTHTSNRKKKDMHLIDREENPNLFMFGFGSSYKLQYMVQLKYIQKINYTFSI